MKLKRSERFQKLLRDQTPEERRELLESIRENGQREPIVVMQGDVIVDGYHRDDICRELGMEPKVVVKTFESDDEAEQWILRNQLARRNLSQRDFKVAVGRLYNSLKGDRVENLKKGKNPEVFPKCQSDTSGDVAAEIADETGVSVATVKRNGAYVKALDSLAKPARTVVDNFPDACPEKAVVALSKLDEAKQKEAAKAVRAGDTLTAAVEAVKPRKRKQGREVSVAGLVDTLRRKYVGPLARGIDTVAKENGGKGPQYKIVDDAIEVIEIALKQMREGKK